MNTMYTPPGGRQIIYQDHKNHENISLDYAATRDALYVLSGK